MKEIILMPLDSNEKEKARATYFAALSRKFDEIKVSEKKEPDFFRLQQLLKDKQNYAANTDEITALAYKYVTENRVDSVVLFRHDKFDLVISLLAVCDKKLAEDIARDMNADKGLKTTFEFRDHFAGLGKSRPVDSTKIFKELKIHTVERDREPIPEGSDAQTRIDNLKILYKVLTKDATSIFHFNSSEYERMVSSIKAVMDYSDRGANEMDHRVLNALLKNVAKQTEHYIKEKEAAPGSPLGQARLTAAFGVLQTTDREKFDVMLKKNNRALRKEFRESEQAHIDIMGFASGNKFEAKTIETILNANKINEILTVKERIECLDNNMKALQEQINDFTAPGDRGSKISEYMGYKALKQRIMKSKDIVPTQEQFDESTSKVFWNKSFQRVLNNNLSVPIIDMEKFAKEVIDDAIKMKKANVPNVRIASDAELEKMAGLSKNEFQKAVYGKYERMEKQLPEELKVRYEFWKNGEDLPRDLVWVYSGGYHDNDSGNMADDEVMEHFSDMAAFQLRRQLYQHEEYRELSYMLEDATLKKYIKSTAEYKAVIGDREFVPRDEVKDIFLKEKECKVFGNYKEFANKELEKIDAIRDEFKANHPNWAKSLEQKNEALKNQPIKNEPADLNHVLGL